MNASDEVSEEQEVLCFLEVTHVCVRGAPVRTGGRT